MDKFKDPQNRWVTVGLFRETCTTSDDYVIMTLEEARQRFVDCGDITGIDFADKYLGGFQHWKAVQGSARLKPIIAEWMEELEVRIRSQQIKRIDSLAGEGQFQAAKFLADRGWEKRGAGRPSKEEVERETRVQAKMDKEFTSDIARIKR